jgi:hypothetical protein
MWAFEEKHGTAATSIEELEAVSLYELPAPGHPRPIFRSTCSLKPGRYLVFIEPPRSGFLTFSKLLIYSNEKGLETEVKTCWNWAVDDVIKLDDESRRESKTTTQPSTQLAPSDDPGTR